MKDYASYSFWLETSGDDLTPRPRLDGSIDVDVAVMGAGYTGLWTAYYLLTLDPSIKIAIKASRCPTVALIFPISPYMSVASASDVRTTTPAKAVPVNDRTRRRVTVTMYAVATRTKASCIRE